ncbi:MAG: hypothetical protein LBS96_04785 [Oscillospiraceae bacterium]|jgi:hypothetical protein|nr:hypothetical protein [Oscillospiraceae bacterium]
MKKKLLPLFSFALGVAATILLVALLAAASGNKPIVPTPSAYEAPTAPTALFPVNSHGETYGSSSIGNPDLVAAIGVDGKEGYIRQNESEGFSYEPTSPEDALRWELAYLKKGGGEYINLYDQEGEVIGRSRAGYPEDDATAAQLQTRILELEAALKEFK